MTNLDSIFKSRNITLPTKVHLVKAMVFPMVMHGCESWTVKEAERRRTDAFELGCWRKLLRVPWTVAHQAPQSMGFSRQEYWNGLPFPSPGDLPYPGIKPRSPGLQVDSFKYVLIPYTETSLPG